MNDHPSISALVDKLTEALANDEIGYDNVCAILEAAQKAMAVLEDQ